MTPTLRQRLAWLRLSAACLALFALVGVGQLLPALHFAFVAHRLCAEHGELVHGVASAEEPAAEAADPSLVADAPAAHDHEHCSALALPAGPAVLGAAASPGRLDYGQALGGSVGERAAHVDVELLLYAPKLPPPLAAFRA